VKLQLGINKCTNLEYHGDKTFLSSSGLKKLLKSPAEFNEERINPKEQAENPAFTEGSLLHSLVLEPNLVASEYSIFPGLRKQGKEFEAFKEENKGRVIVSKPQYSRCLAYKRAFDSNEVATGLLNGCESEYSICAEISGVGVKVRFDGINLNDSYGLDLKTSSFPVDRESFKMTMNQYGYGLSAALYSWVAELHFGRPFDFYMIPIAKQELDCQVFRMSQETVMRGRSDIVKALDIYKKCCDTGVWPESVTMDKKLQTEIEEI
jgi:PDDEXK-like domain of unknown function (DUF3799)